MKRGFNGLKQFRNFNKNSIQFNFNKRQFKIAGILVGTTSYHWKNVVEFKEADFVIWKTKIVKM